MAAKCFLAQQNAAPLNMGDAESSCTWYHHFSQEGLGHWGDLRASVGVEFLGCNLAL